MKNRMFGDDEPGRATLPSPRTTIVGGRPPEAGAVLPPIPTGLQRLLRLASADAAFEAELVRRRADLAPAAGIELAASERAILAAASADQLRAMIASLPAPPMDRRAFLKEAAVAALAALAGTQLAACRKEAPAQPPEGDAGADPSDAAIKVERPTKKKTLGNFAILNNGLE